MTHKEICSILKACVKSKVKEITLGDLHVKFNMDAEVMPQTVPVTESVRQAQKKQDQKTLDQLEDLVKQNQLDNLLIEDPLEYERLLVSKELEDGDGRKENPGRLESELF